MNFAEFCKISQVFAGSGGNFATSTVGLGSPAGSFFALGAKIHVCLVPGTRWRGRARVVGVLPPVVGAPDVISQILAKFSQNFADFADFRRISQLLRCFLQVLWLILVENPVPGVPTLFKTFKTTPMHLVSRAGPTGACHRCTVAPLVAKTCFWTILGVVLALGGTLCTTGPHRPPPCHLRRALARNPLHRSI